MKILITGAYGELGRHIVKRLINDHELILTSRRLPEFDLAKTYQIDLTDPVNLADILAGEKPEAIIHLAALVGSACESDPGLANKINVNGTKILAELAAKNSVKKFLFASSAAVYDQTELAATDEDHNVNPRSVYGKTKLQAELELQKLNKGNMQPIILRPFNLYGPGMDKSLVNRLAGSSTAGSVSLIGFDHYYRDYVHVRDVTTAFNSCLMADKELPVLNIGSGQALSNHQLVNKLKEKGINAKFTVDGDAKSVSWADIRQAEMTISFSPATELMLEGLSE